MSAIQLSTGFKVRGNHEYTVHIPDNCFFQLPASGLLPIIIGIISSVIISFLIIQM